MTKILFIVDCVSLAGRRAKGDVVNVEDWLAKQLVSARMAELYKEVETVDEVEEPENKMEVQDLETKEESVEAKDAVRNKSNRGKATSKN